MKGAEIVVTATNSAEPVLARDWIEPGTHINAVGACLPRMRELDIGDGRGGRAVRRPPGRRCWPSPATTCWPPPTVPPGRSRSGPNSASCLPGRRPGRVERGRDHHLRVARPGDRGSRRGGARARDGGPDQGDGRPDRQLARASEGTAGMREPPARPLRRRDNTPSRGAGVLSWPSASNPGYRAAAVGVASAALLVGAFSLGASRCRCGRPRRRRLSPLPSRARAASP